MSSLNLWTWACCRKGWGLPHPLPTGNVKTVKEQTFHKHSTNVPTSNRIKPKRLICSQICPIERAHFYLVQESRFWTRWKQSVLNKPISGTIPKRLVSFPKRYRNVCPFVFDIAIIPTHTTTLTPRKLLPTVNVNWQQLHLFSCMTRLQL